MKLEFQTPPAVGSVMMDGTQAFEVVQVEPYTRKDGAASRLIVWRTTCLNCAEPFEVTTGMKTSGMNRRCPMHRNPGRRAHRKDS